MNKNNLKDGFTLVEVIILFVIFITVAVLVVPLAVDDAVTAKYTAKWQHAQSGFASIPISLMNSQSYKKDKTVNLEDFIEQHTITVNQKDKFYKIGHNLFQSYPQIIRKGE